LFLKATSGVNNPFGGSFPLEKNRILDGVVTGIKVLNIMEENAEAVEVMTNRAIKETNDQGIKILNVLATGDNLILVLGEKEP
jgi:hypothetical protein